MFVVLALLFTLPLTAQGPQDPVEIQAFFDGIYAAQKEAHHLSGMTVGIVRDGKVIFLKGYGYGDIDAHKSVDPETTMFRIGSISKTFVWTGLMQLAAEQKIDLKADVRRYAPDVRIPSAFDRPITIENLMTHTPGLEDRPIVGLFSRTPDGRKLSAILNESVPGQFFEPGTVLSYSNWGSGLAGYILERVSGVPYADYIERNILQPLGMKYATARQPVPNAVAPYLAKGYKWENGLHKAQDFEFVPLAPAGGMSASAGAMTRYMLAHLQLGGVDGARILDEDSAREMHKVLFTHNPRLPGWLHGFFQYRRGDVTAFGHGGSTLWFHSNMLLFPEARVGLFYSYNSNTGAQASGQTFNAFVDHYFPSQPFSPPKASAETKDRARQIAGWYTGARRDRSGILKLTALLDAARVSVAEDGHLIASRPGGPVHLYEIEPWVFRDREGKSTMIFHRDASGRVTRAFGPMPIADLERVPSTDSVVFTGALLVPAFLFLCSAVIAWPLAALTNRIRQVHMPQGARLARLSGWLVATMLGVVLLLILQVASKENEIVFGAPASLDVALWLARIAMLFAIVPLLYAFLAWPRHYWSFWVRTHYTFVALSICAIAWSLWHWGLA